MNEIDLDMDLLEFCDVSNYFYQKTIEEQVITEYEMTISIYDTQRFLIEQNTSIMEYLEFDYINEGVIKTIWDGILKIIRGIRDLIKKFINFIRGNKNDDINYNENKPETEIVKDNQKKQFEVDKELEQLANSIKNSFDQNLAENTKKEVNEYKERLEKLKNSKYHLIMVENNVTASDIFKLSNSISNQIHTLYTVVNVSYFDGSNTPTKWPSDVFNNLYEYGIKVEENKISNREYYTKYFDKVNRFYGSYTERDIDKVCENMNKCSSEFKKIEDSIDRLQKTEINDEYKDEIKKIYNETLVLSKVITRTIMLLKNVKIGFIASRDNRHKLFRTNVTLNSMKDKLNKHVAKLK